MSGLPSIDQAEHLQQLCDEGQALLVQTRYLEAEALLESAETLAWTARDWDTLARLYMPLQETRRQRRQRCGEGAICLDLIASGPHDSVDGHRVIENYPEGQLLVAGWQSLAPAAEVRRLQKEHGLYVETFLGAAYAVGGERIVIIAPTEDARLPQEDFGSIEALQQRLPAHCLLFRAGDLPHGVRKGTWQTYAEVMAMWERLHAPFLAAADARTDPLEQMQAYRQAIRVDYACELAHQRLSDTARQMGRHRSPQ